MARDLAETVPPDVLEAFGFAGAACDRLSGGNVNAHWLATLGDESRVFARHHIARPAAAVTWAQSLEEFAAERGWPIPQGFSTISGATIVEHGGLLWSAAAYVPGEHPSASSVPMHHIYGRMLARLHHDIESFPVEGQRPAAGKAWELDTWVAPAQSGTFNDLLALFGREYGELAAGVRRYRYRNLRELSRLHYPDLADRPIHGDWSADNLLWKDGTLAAVLDFDFSRRDALACDIAANFPWDDRGPGVIAAFLRGYEEERPLDDAEWDVLPALARAQLLFHVAIRLVEWRLLGDDGVPHSVARTVGRRLPRTEQLERQLGELRGARAT